MPDILQDFPIGADAAAVFGAVSTPFGLDQWWTESSTGLAEVGASYLLRFGPEHVWHARVTACTRPARFELTFTVADDDWLGTSVGFLLSPAAAGTQVRFYHRGWPEENEHFRISSHCWALYLRLLRRYLTHGEVVPYAARLDA